MFKLKFNVLSSSFSSHFHHMCNPAFESTTYGSYSSHDLYCNYLRVLYVLNILYNSLIQHYFQSFNVFWYPSFICQFVMYCHFVEQFSESMYLKYAFELQLKKLNLPVTSKQLPLKTTLQLCLFPPMMYMQMAEKNSIYNGLPQSASLFGENSRRQPFNIAFKIRALKTSTEKNQMKVASGGHKICLSNQLKLSECLERRIDAI